MSTTRSERRPRRRAAAAALVFLVAAGCSSGDPEPVPAPQAPATSAESPVVTAPDVARQLARALARRADAVRRRDRAAFLAGVDDTDAPFASSQGAYLDNLAQLPLQTFDYRLDRTSLVREGGSYWAEVEVSLQIEGYDAVPVVTRDRYLFTRAPRDRFRVASVSDEEWEERHDVRSEPWDSGPVTVVEGAGVLAVFDAGSAARAAGVVSDVEAGIADVAAEVPYEWDRRVVVYALSDPAYLTGLHGLPGDDPLALDAVTFPVLSRPGGEVAATRFLLNPRVLGQPGLSRGRLIRHELTHVALGERLEDVPTWFSEGLAEYVSVRPLAPEQRAVSRGALEAAEQGLDELPSDDGFHGPASETHYGVAWWACEYLAEAYDEPMLWVLLDSMAAPGDNDSVLPRVLQLDEEQLARRAGRLLLQTYRPQEREEPAEPKESEEPEESPDASPSGSSEGSPSGSPTP